MAYAKTSSGLIYWTDFPGAALPAEFTEKEGDLNTGNLLADQDCSFEGAGVGGWGNLWNCAFVNDAANGYHGTHSAKMTMTGAGVAEAVLNVTALTAAGTEYSYAIKLKSATGRTYLIQFEDNVSGRQSSATVTADGTWQTVNLTATFGAGSGWREINVRADGDALGGDIVYWDSAILILGAGPVNPPTTFVADPVSVAAGVCTIETDCDRAAAIIHTTDHYTSYLTAGSIVARTKAKMTVQPAADHAQGLGAADLAAAPVIGINDLDTEEPVSLIVDAATDRRADYRAANIYNVAAGAINTYDIHEIRFDATDAFVRCLDAATMAVHAGCEGSNAYAYTDDLWFFAGERRTDNYYGTMLLDYFQLYLANTITVSGLISGSGYTVKLYNSSDVEKSSANESGGLATLNAEACEFPFSGYFKIFDGATELRRLPATGNFTGEDLWGGDIWPGCENPVLDLLIPTYGWTNDKIALVGSKFGAAQGSSKVEFNGVEATEIISWADTQIVCTVPSGATTGDVVVTT